MVKIISVVITGLYLDQNCPYHPGTLVTEVPLDFLLVELPSDCSYFNVRLCHAHINSSPTVHVYFSSSARKQEGKTAGIAEMQSALYICLNAIFL
jgi:hypothetical protein